MMEETNADIEALKEELLKESKSYCYPSTKKQIQQRYKNTAYELHKAFEKLEFRTNFLSFGSRRSSTLSNYGNTPIVMRRSVSSNGELSATQAYHFGSLRGVPAQIAEEEAKYSTQFGSLRGLPTNKRLSKFDEMEEESAAAAALVAVHKVNGSHGELSEKFSDDKSEQSWDAASVGQGGSISKGKGKKGHKSGGLFRRKKDEHEKHKDKWRGSGDELKGDLSTKSSPLHEVHREIQKSSESLVSVKRKKPWWFRRKKSKETMLLSEREDEKPNENEDAAKDERVNLNEKAVSDNNLKIQNNEDTDNVSLHEELRKSQILLKGYSQRNVAGLSLSKRLSGASQSVTSRTSLSGSDVMISDSSKSFMQYELPRVKDHSSGVMLSKNTVSDMIREGQTYEEQFETSLGSDSQSTVHFVSNSAVEVEDLPANRKATVGAAPAQSLPGEQRLDVNAKHTDLALEELESLDRMLGELQESNVDETPIHHLDKERGEVELRHKPEPLSPDSRPIRPLHFSAPVKSAASPPHIRPNVAKTASLPGQESYPHSLMDRPITSRLAKRLSSEMEAKDLTSDQSDLGKKSNIAYTLTFDKELICVNLRTKSAPGGPNAPIAVSADPSAVPEVPLSSLKHPSSDMDGEGLSGTERQYPGAEDRETSPGYRLAYPKSGLRSPTPSKFSQRKNPKVTREKDRLAGSSILPPESQNDKEVQNDPNEAASSVVKENSPRDRKVSITNIVKDDTEEQVLRIEVKSGILETPTSTFEIPMFTEKSPTAQERLDLELSNSAEKSVMKNFDNIESTLVAEQGDCRPSLSPENSSGTGKRNESGDSCEKMEEMNDEKPVPKLQRRNTFTLSTSSVKSSEHANGVSETQHNHQLNGNKDHTSHTNGDVDSEARPKSPPSTSSKSPMLEHTSLLKSPAHVSAGSPNLSGNKTRIPVRRGGTSESAGKPRIASKIPMMSAGVPERSSLRAKRGGVAARGSAHFPGTNPSGVRGIPSRKPSITDCGAAAAKIGAVTSPLTDNFLKTDNNTIVIKRETFLQITPEATSTICSVM